MYSEFRNTTRDQWKFTYKGSELLEAAKKKVAFFAAREDRYRTELAAAMNDRKQNLNSSKNDKLKNNASSAATQKEACEVFAHEFKRTPDREFHLNLGDVVYFGLAGHAIQDDDND